MKLSIWVQILGVIILGLLIGSARYSQNWYGFAFLVLVVIVTQHQKFDVSLEESSTEARRT